MCITSNAAAADILQATCDGAHGARRINVDERRFERIPRCTHTGLNEGNVVPVTVNESSSSHPPACQIRSPPLRRSGRGHRRPCDEAARHRQGVQPLTPLATLIFTCIRFCHPWSSMVIHGHPWSSMVIHGHPWRQQRFGARGEECEVRRRVGMGEGVGHTHAPHAQVRQTQTDPDRPSQTQTDPDRPRQTQTDPDRPRQTPDRPTDRPTDRRRHRRFVKGSNRFCFCSLRLRHTCVRANTCSRFRHTLSQSAGVGESWCKGVWVEVHTQKN